MRALIDTNIFLWFISDSNRLSINARNYIANLDNELMLSVASLWEIAIKTSTGKLELLKPFEELIPEQLEINKVQILPIELNHLSNVNNLPFHHRDPFDRLIIAQGISEGLPIITSDSEFKNYQVNIIW